MTYFRLELLADLGPEYVQKDYKTALRMITYERIHLLRDVEHRSIQRIADDLGLNFRTVKNNGLILKWILLLPFAQICQESTKNPAQIEQDLYA